jgi:hypothetical protein
VPYPLLLGIFVGLLDLVPVVGSTIAGVVVAAVALAVSLPVCIATIAFFVTFRLGEDYLLVPKIIGRVVKVPALITVVAVLIGGALLGIVGALVAIPIAAALQLVTQHQHRRHRRQHSHRRVGHGDARRSHQPDVERGAAIESRSGRTQRLLRGAELRRELLSLGDRSLVLAVRLSHHVAVRRSRDVVV